MEIKAEALTAIEGVLVSFQDRNIDISDCVDSLNWIYEKVLQDDYCSFTKKIEVAFNELKGTEK